MTDLLKEKLKLDKQIDKLIIKRQALYDSCPCSPEFLVSSSFYHEGSYYDKSYTEYYDECLVCGKRHNKRTGAVGYYS